VIVAWPYPSTEFGLQSSVALGLENWINVTNVPVQVGGQWQITAEAKGNQFYRLAGHDSVGSIDPPAN
jgi:hypothetical protein